MEIYCGIFCKFLFIPLFRRKTHRDMYFCPMLLNSNCNCNVTRIQSAWMHFMRHRKRSPSWVWLWPASEWRNGIGSRIYVLQRIYIEAAALESELNFLCAKCSFCVKCTFAIDFSINCEHMNVTAAVCVSLAWTHAEKLQFAMGFFVHLSLAGAKMGKILA